ncbi:MAG: hypothetical protein O7B24_12320, partial [Alphaproteobacteria bacterium]|nr:hypothetical protein [Alphaproteobacteria bacterium]
ATDEIASQISMIQGSTMDSVTAIKNISDAVHKINDMTTTIASAIAEQDAVTQKIAHNAQNASTSTIEVTSNIVEVSRSTKESGAAAKSVLQVAKRLDAQSDELQNAVSQYLETMREA